VFFDYYGLVWEYEKEGFKLSDGTYYLPDFWLPYVKCSRKDVGFWVEIKPDGLSDNEFKKCRLLCFGSGNCVYALTGSFHQPNDIVLVKFSAIRDEPWKAGPTIDVKVEHLPGARAFCCLLMNIGISQGVVEYSVNPDPWPGIADARSARFEFGQSGAT
jgi:hypothetical protein